MRQESLGVIHSPLRDALAERYPPSRRLGPGRHAERDKDMNFAPGNDAYMTARRAVLLNGAFGESGCPREAPSRPGSALGPVVGSHILVYSNDATSECDRTIHERHCFVCSYSYLNDRGQSPISQNHFGMMQPRASHPGRLSSWA